MVVYNPFRNDARVLKEARTLADAGHDVRVIAALDAAMPAREERDGFRVVRVDRDPLPTKLARHAARGRSSTAGRATPGEAPPPLVAPDRHGALLRLVRRTHIAWDHAKFLRLAYRDLRREPADVIVAHDLDTLPAAIHAKRRIGGRVLYDSHELFIERQFTTPPQTRIWRPGWRAIERRLIRRADRVITVSPAIAAELASRYGIPEPDVIMNVPDRRRAPEEPRDLRGHLGLAADSTLVLYLGGILPHRGVDATVRSLALRPGDELVLLGPAAPGEVDLLREVAREAGVGRRVHVLPPVPSDEVVAWAAGADVGVCLIENIGLSYFHSLPNKLFEYFGAGVPVITSDFPTMGTVVRDAGAGVTCDPRDPAAIAAAIHAVVDDPARHAALRERALAASGRYTWEVEGARYLDLVEALGPAA